MIISSILMRNFLPYAGENPIFFATDKLMNVTVIHGENTKGKTSLLNAFRWVLYGHPVSDGELLQPKDLMNKEALAEGENEFEVEIRFTHAGKNYEMSRGARIGSNGIWEVTPSLKEGGIPIASAHIPKIINGIAPEEVSRFFLFDGELLKEYEELVKHTSTSAQKIKESIERVLGVPALLESVDALEEVHSVLRKAANDEAKKSKSHGAATETMEEKIAELERLKSERQELVAINEECQRQIDELTGDIDRHEDKFKESQEKSTLEGRLSTISDLVSSKKNQFTDMLSTLWVAICTSVINKEIDSDADSVTEFDEHLTEILRLAKNSSNCPVCDTEITTSTRASIVSKLEDLYEITEKSGLSDMSASLRKLGSVSSITTEGLISLEKEIITLEVESDEVSKKISDLTKRLQGFAADEVSKQYASRAQQIHNLEVNNKNLVSLDRKIADIEKEMSSLEEVIKAHGSQKSIKAMNNSEKANDVLMVLRSSVDLLRNALRAKVEKKATDAFINLTSRRADYRSLSINENYGLEIVNDEGETVPLKSAGASQIVALSLIAGLNQTGKSPGPVIMDTPFGRLDVVHRENILQYMPKTASQFIVLVHSGEVGESGMILSKIASRIGRTWKIESINAYKSTIMEVAS